MKKVLFSVGCAVFFAGCTIHGPSVEVPTVEIPVVEVPVIRVDPPVKVVPFGPSYYNYDRHGHGHKYGHGHSHGGHHKHWH